MAVFPVRRFALPVLLVLATPVSAFNFGNMMNPGKWFGGDNDRDDYYYDDNYGPAGGYGYPGYPYDAGYGAPGYAVPGYGAPGYTAPGYTAPGYAAPGYAAPGYTAPGYAAPGYAPGGYVAPGYTAPAPAAPAAPAASSSTPAYVPPAVTDSDTAEIERLKARVRELEQEKYRSVDTWQAPAESANYDAPAPRDTGAGASIDSWQTPATATGGDDAQTPYVSDWRPSYVTPGMGAPGAAERGAANYRPPSQYPGQQTYDLGK